MKTRIVKGLLLICIVLTTAVAMGEEEKPQVLNTQTASCLVKVSSDPAVIELDPKIIDHLIRSSNIAGAAAVSRLDVSPDACQELFSVEPLSCETVVLPAGEASTRVRSQRTPGSGSRSVCGTLLFRLAVDLRERDVRPAAEAFMVEIINNLRRRLYEAFDLHRNELGGEIHAAQEERETAERELSEVIAVEGSSTEADHETRRQLLEIVELGELNPEMAFGDAIESLKHSVNPSLKIVVLWRDLDNIGIDQADPIQMDSISGVKLGKALELLLKSVSDEPGEVRYEIEDGVITIGTRKMVRSHRAEGPEITQPRVSVKKLLERRQDLLGQKWDYEMDIAQKRARQDAIEQQIQHTQVLIERNLERDPIARELQVMIEMHIERVNRIRGSAAKKGSSGLEAQEFFKVGLRDEARENLAKAKIELARRREDLNKTAGGDRLDDYNRDLAGQAIERAENEAVLKLLDERLKQTEAQLKEASRFAPRIARIDLGKERLEVADHRLNELKIRLAGLRRPTVTVVGAD